MKTNDECPVCKNGTLEKNGEDLVCRGECGFCLSAQFQLGYSVGHAAGRRSLQHEVAVMAAALETPGDLTDADLVHVIHDASSLAAELEQDAKLCRTCGDEYHFAGDGWDGECPVCADKTAEGKCPACKKTLSKEQRDELWAREENGQDHGQPCPHCNYGGACILTGADGEDPDDCSTHNHENH